MELGATSKGEGSGPSDRERRGLEGGSFTADALDALRFVAAGVVAGFVCGAVIGGLGGRMAMFLLQLTSDPWVGFPDAFGFGDTILLVVFAAAVGVIGGVAYLWIRRWLPAKGQAVITGVAAAVVGGALVIGTGGFDFSLLEPLWLAVALVVVLPGLYGFAVSWSVERLLADRSVLHRLGGWGAAPVVLLVLGGLLAVVFGHLPAGPLAGVMVVIGAGWWVVRRYPRLIRWWRSEPITWVGRVALATVTVFAAVQLVRVQIVRVQGLDLSDFTEALLLGDGPLSVGPPSGFMGGFPFGSQITVRFLNTVDPEWREVVRDLTGGCDGKIGGLLSDGPIPCAMGLTFTYSETSDRERMEDAIQGGLDPLRMKSGFTTHPRRRGVMDQPPGDVRGVAVSPRSTTRLGLL